MGLPAVKQQNQAMTKVSDMLAKNHQQLVDALQGSGLQPEVFNSAVLNTLRKSPQLQRCNAMSLWVALMEAADCGLTIGGEVSQCHLVPYKDECKLQIGYRGLLALVDRTGKLKLWRYGVVRKGDIFEMSDDPMDQRLRFVHGPGDRSKRPITHVWVGFELTNGARIYDVMTKAEIDEHAKKFSKAYGKADSPWQTHWETMAMKTVLMRPIRRGLVPMAKRDSSRVRTVLSRDDAPFEEDVIEVESAVLEQSPPEPEPTKNDQVPALLKSLFATVNTLKATDDLEKSLQEDYPDHRQVIHELSEWRRSVLRGEAVEAPV